METGFQLAAVHGMLYTGGNVCFSPDGRTLFSPVQNYISAIQLYREGTTSMTCSNSSIQCFDLSPDGDLIIAIGGRGLGFFYSISARVTLDTISFPPQATVQTVKFSPCGKYVALGLENTLQVYSAPARRVVQFHACHRIENHHSVLALPIHHVEWSSDSEHLLVSGEDARMKIVPRQLKPHVKGHALQQNMLVGHRMAVLGAWFVDPEDRKVVSVAADNVVAVWRRTEMPRKELLQAIARSRMNARLAGGKSKRNKKNKKSRGDSDGEEEEEDEEEENEEEELDEQGEVIPQSFIEKQRLKQLAEDGVRVSDADDSLLPPILKYAYELEKKHLLTHKGNVTVTSFHRARGLVAIGYNSGIFAIHTLASEDTNDFTLVHLLSISAQALTAAAFSPNGDLVSFGSAHLKQLLVWDWKSESYVLKEQAHYYDITRTAVSADSRLILSGGDDGKVKVWSAASGNCYVTFNDHTGPISGIVTCAATNAVFTSSLDGTARGFDLVRYRSFRVFTPPTDCQLSCIAVDGSGEVLAVGSSSMNQIFVFSVQTGRIIDLLQGHEAPIITLAFHPSGTTLVSGSMDHNLCFWELFAQDQSGSRLKGDGEVLNIGSEVLYVAYSGSGRRMAVLTAKGEISVYETTLPSEPELLKTFQTSFDAAGGWKKDVGPNKTNYQAHFTTMAFSPEGERLVVGGDSKWMVMYHALQGHVLYKWPVTTNLDVLGAEEQYQWRQMTEAGFVGDIDVEDMDIHLQRRKILEMPGSRHRHFATGKRMTELTARTHHLSFSLTGMEFVAATTDGLLVFSARLSRPKFAPLQYLTATITTAHVRELLHPTSSTDTAPKYIAALIGALSLDDAALLVECVRCMPRESIPIAVHATPSIAFGRLLRVVAEEVERGGPYFQSSLLWAQAVVLYSNENLSQLMNQNRSHTSLLLSSKGGSSASNNNNNNNSAGGEYYSLLPALRNLSKSLHQYKMLATMSQENYSSLQYLMDVSRIKKTKKKGKEESA